MIRLMPELSCYPELTLVPWPAETPRVLLVEDDLLLKQRLARALRGDGHVVIEGDRAGLLARVRALRAGREEVPEMDLVVCDTRGLTDLGFAALKALRRLDRALPIVMVGDRRDPTFEHYARVVQAEVVAAHPVEVDEVRATVEELVAS